LKSETKEGENAESTCGSDYEEDDYTSAGESTGTGRISGATSETGDETSGLKKTTDNSEENDEEETRAESVSVSEWSEFTTSRHVPKVCPEEEEPDRVSHSTSTHDMALQSPNILVDCEPLNRSQGSSDVSPPEPVEPESNSFKRKFVPVPPEDYDPPTGPYRDAAVVAQNRLPFMTPIVEKTESSISSTVFEERNDPNTKTPSKRVRSIVSENPMISEMGDLLLSSPFQEFTQSNDAGFDYVHDDGSPSKIAKKKRSPLKKLSKVKNKQSRTAAIIKEAQCNPVEPAIREKILRHINPPLQSYPGYHDHTTQTGGHAAEIRKYIKGLGKGPKANGTEKTLLLPPVLYFPGGTRSYAIKRELGVGGNAPVYLAESVDSPDTYSSDSEREQETNGNKKRHLSSKGTTCKPRCDPSRQSLEAIKVETGSPSAWEFYMLRIAHDRLSESPTHYRSIDSIIQAHEMHHFRDEGFLVEDYQGQGTLIDLVNAVRTEDNGAAGGTDQGLEEVVAMFFAVELFRTVEALHACGILHGDIKPDNCLVRVDGQPCSTFSLLDDDFGIGTDEIHYSPTGACNWRKQGITLIDFGRGIDMQAFLPSVQFVADWKIGAHECSEMREFRPWTYQIDMYGLGNTIYVLLFGKYMEVAPVVIVSDNGNGSSPGRGLSFRPGVGSRKVYRIKESLKRYWEREIWSDLFDLCLNPTSEKWMEIERKNGWNETTTNFDDFGISSNHTMPPVLNSMRLVREKMEAWLVSNAERKGLQNQLRKLETLIARKRDKRSLEKV
jgi:checkpoint serine/threonine-protein kinase